MQLAGKAVDHLQRNVALLEQLGRSLAQLLGHTSLGDVAQDRGDLILATQPDRRQCGLDLHAGAVGTQMRPFRMLRPLCDGVAHQRGHLIGRSLAVRLQGRRQSLGRTAHQNLARVPEQGQRTRIAIDDETVGDHQDGVSGRIEDAAVAALAVLQCMEDLYLPQQIGHRGGELLLLAAPQTRSARMLQAEHAGELPGFVQGRDQGGTHAFRPEIATLEFGHPQIAGAVVHLQHAGTVQLRRQAHQHRRRHDLAGFEAALIRPERQATFEPHTILAELPHADTRKLQLPGQGAGYIAQGAVQVAAPQMLIAHETHERRLEAFTELVVRSSRRCHAGDVFHRADYRR